MDMILWSRSVYKYISVVLWSRSKHDCGMWSRFSYVCGSEEKLGMFPWFSIAGEHMACGAGVEQVCTLSCS